MVICVSSNHHGYTNETKLFFFENLRAQKKHVETGTNRKRKKK